MSNKEALNESVHNIPSELDIEQVDSPKPLTKYLVGLTHCPKLKVGAESEKVAIQLYDNWLGITDSIFKHTITEYTDDGKTQPKPEPKPEIKAQPRPQAQAKTPTQTQPNKAK